MFLHLSAGGEMEHLSAKEAAGKGESMFMTQQQGLLTATIARKINVPHSEAWRRGPPPSWPQNQRPGQELQRSGRRVEPVGCCSSVAASKQGVELSRLLPADTHLSRLQGLQRGEGDAQAFGPHGRSSRLQVLVPERRQINSGSDWGQAGRKSLVHMETTPTRPPGWTYLAVVFFIQSSQGIFPQNGIWTICWET